MVEGDTTILMCFSPLKEPFNGFLTWEKVRLNMSSISIGIKNFDVSHISDPSLLDRFSINNTDGSLKIKNVRISDAGYYFCTSIGKRKAERAYVLNVRGRL